MGITGSKPTLQVALENGTIRAGPNLEQAQFAALPEETVEKPDVIIY
jgi:hypothetical protein